LQGKKLPETLRGREVTFSELADSALEYSKLHKRSYRMDKSRMAFLKKAFGNRAADSITPQDIQKWIADDLSEHKPATQNRYRALLCLVYRLAMENGRVTVNPARLVRQKAENNGRIRYLLTEEEVRLRTVLMEKFPHRICELDFALNVGLRKTNQYELTWNDIDFDRRTVSVGRSKNGAPLNLPLNDSAIAALRTAQKYSNGSPAIFLNRVGHGLRDNRHWFDTAKKEAKIQGFRWHDLRHTFVSHLVMVGVDIVTVSKLAGHKTIQVTMRYAHLAPQHQLEAVPRLCALSQGAQEEAGSTTRSTSAFEYEVSTDVKPS
jgi:integrase